MHNFLCKLVLISVALAPHNICGLSCGGNLLCYRMAHRFIYIRSRTTGLQLAYLSDKLGVCCTLATSFYCNYNHGKSVLIASIKFELFTDATRIAKFSCYIHLNTNNSGANRQIKF